MADFERARWQMVETQLRTTGITDRRLLAVMGRVPRERFVPEARRDLAYIDDVQPIEGTGSVQRWFAAPSPFAKLLELAEIGSDDIVLDVGCANGYSTAVIAGLAASVVALDEDAELVRQANDNLAGLDIGNAAAIAGPLERGVPREAPFDVIIIEGAVRQVPKALFDQLSDGGRLVALVNGGPAGVATLYVRSGGDILARRTFNASLPVIGSLSQAETFVF